MVAGLDLDGLGKRFSLLLLAAAVSGCALLAPGRGKPATVTFVDKVWRVVAPSDIAVGALYVFLSDGTLVIASPDAQPLVGTWSFADGVFTMVEEGIAYRVDVVGLSADGFMIRSRNPGPPVLIRMVPADAPPPEAEAAVVAQ